MPEFVMCRYPIRVCLYAVVMLTAGGWFCFLTPALRVPDEHTHIFRADQVSQGTFFASKTESGFSGGKIDRAFADLSFFVSELDAKQGGRHVYRTEDLRRMNSFKAVGERISVAFPNTASYFAAGYLPQAAGLIIGRIMTDRATDQIVAARLANLLVFVIVMSSALLLMPGAAPAILCFSMLPMVQFQVASASQDASIFAFSGLAAALYLRAVTRWTSDVGTREAAASRATSMRALTGFSLCLLFISLARPTYLPLVVLVPAMALVFRDKRLFILAGALCLLVVLCLGAQLYHISTLGSPTTKPGIDPGAQLRFIMAHPIAYLHMSIDSFKSDLVLGFIGTLGLLDMLLPTSMYRFCRIIIGIAAVLQLAVFCTWAWPARWRLGLSTATVLCALLVAVAVIVEFIATSLFMVWTIPGSALIEGMQGRYFLTPGLFLLALAPAALAPLVQKRWPQNWQIRDRLLLDVVTLSWAVLLPAILVSQGVVAMSLLTYYN